MENVRIIAIHDDYIIVKAATERFGKDEVLFEGNTFNQCFDYCKKELRKDRLNLQSSFLYESYTDREGRTFPWHMEVVA